MAFDAEIPMPIYSLFKADQANRFDAGE